MRAYVDVPRARSSDQNTESRGDADGAGAAEPLCAARSRAARRRCGGDDRSGHFALLACWKSLASRGCSSASGRCATPRRRAGRCLESRAVRGGADPHRAAAGRRAVCARRSTARSSCSSAPGPAVRKRTLMPITISRWLAGCWPGRRRPPVDRNRPCSCWTRPASASRPSRRSVPVEARNGWRPFASRTKADCFRDLGRLDDAAATYEDNIRRAEQLGDDRQVAVGKAQLGTVRKDQRCYPEALAAY